jgi:hypothetical protein
MNTCLICYDDYSRTVQCPLCNSHMCYECSEQYFNSCFNENKIPKCINTKCPLLYTTSIFKKHKFNNIINIDIYDKIVNDNEKTINDQILTEIEVEKKINKMRNDVLKRKQLFESKIPEGMREITSMLSKNIFKKKIKQNETELKETEIQNFIECPKTTCTGHINTSTNTCLTCGATICPTCREVKELNHTCKKEVLESLKEINQNAQKCPKCKIDIHKQAGCNDMWCTNCKTHFNYRTGQASSTGHNPEANTYFYKKKRTQIKNHSKPEISDEGIKNTKPEIVNLFNNVYRVLPKIKINKTDKLKLDWQKNKLTKDEYEKKLPGVFESDHISKEYIKLLLDLAEHIFKHTNDTNYDITNIIDDYNKKKEKLSKIYKIGVSLP